MIREHRSRAKLEAYYEKFARDGVLDPNVHPWVADSWQQSKKHGVGMEKMEIHHLLSKEEFHRLEKTPIGQFDESDSVDGTAVPCESEFP
jgi:transcriptional regulator of acetoin/glycerol metabolism